MRWGDVVSALTKQVGVNIINGGKETVMKEFGGDLLNVMKRLVDFTNS